MNNESDDSASSPVIKIAGIALAILVVVYLGATWFVGRAANARIDELVTKIGDQSKGQLQLVDRQTHPGFFTTTVDLTFKVVNPLYAALLTSSESKFTIHNTITHGPFPGLRSVGLARINSTLVLTDEQRKAMVDKIGTDVPLAVAATLGFLGGLHVDIDSPKLTVKRDGGSVLKWEGLEANLDYSAGAKHFTMSAALPGITVTDKYELISIKQMTMNADLTPRLENLYVGNEIFTIGSFSFTKGSAASTTVSDIRYAIDIAENNDYFSVGAKVGAAKLDIAQQGTRQSLQDLHFDFGVEHMQGALLSALVKSYQAYAIALQESASIVVVAAENKDLVITKEANVEAAMAKQAKMAEVLAEPTKQLQADALALLTQSPVFKISHVGYATGAGDLKLTGNAQLHDMTEQDFALGAKPQGFISKLFASGDFSVAQSLIDSWALGMTAQQAKQTFSELEAKGFVKRKGDRMESHLEFKEGKLTANGKPTGP
jgi:uncharacterized protein YdgA (DUF945 family)